jgi:hypothetical protein
MLELYRITYPEYRSLYTIAWDWMRDQPELYGEDVGYDDFSEFIAPPSERIEFALRQDGKLIGFAYFLLRASKTCEFGLITPPRPRVRSVLALLRELQRAYFEQLGFTTLYVEYPDDPRWDRPRQLCRMFGWPERKPNYFEFSTRDYLRAYGGQEKAVRLAADAV